MLIAASWGFIFHMAVLLVLLAVSLHVGSGSVTPQLKFVHPSNRISACSSEPCTFDQFAQNSKQFQSNTTFIFLPGEHQLNTNISLYGVKNVSFRTMTEGSVMIRIGPQGGLRFDNCDGIEINSLHFLLSDTFEYGLIFSNTIDVNLHNIMFRPKDVNSTGFSAILSQSSTVSISNSSFVGITGQRGAALLALNSSEIIFAGRSNNFNNNTANLGGAIHSVSSTLQFTGIASFINNLATWNANNAQLACFSNTVNNDTLGMGGAVFAEESQVIFSNCIHFIGNKATSLGGAIAALNACTVLMNGSCLHKWNRLNPKGSLFDGNHVIPTNYTAQEFILDQEKSYGSGGAIFTQDCVVNITSIALVNNYSPGVGGAAHFVKTNVTLYNIVAVNNTARNFFGGAIRLFSSEHAVIDGDNYFINNSAALFGGAIDICRNGFLKTGGTNLFERNMADRGGAFDIYDSKMNVVCGNNVFKGNTAPQNGGAVFVRNTSDVQFCGSNLFIDCVAGNQGGALYTEDSTVTLNGSEKASFCDNMARFDDGGAIASIDSQLKLYGNIQFHNNFANEGNGGGIALYGTSRIVLNPYTEVDFLGNYAQRNGGAIYFEDSFAFSLNCYVAKAECFIMLNTTYSFLNNASILLNFTNNMAVNYGAVLYGGQLGRCKLLFKAPTNSCGDTMDVEDNSYELLTNSKILQINDEPKHSSIILPANKLCTCDNTSMALNCASNILDTVHINITVSPGQAFGIPMVVQDQRNISVPGVVILSDPVDIEFIPLLPVTDMTTSSSCLNFMYRLFAKSTKDKPSYHLYTSGSCGIYRGHIRLDISLKHCPIGFTFSANESACVCTDELVNADKIVECDVDNKLIKRSRNNFWISITDEYFLIYEGSCPLDFCNDSSMVVAIKPNNPDTQCFEGRTGKICGSCKEGENYSLVLGSLECRQNCSNVYLLLVIPFGILGVLLILVLFLLRLTVSEGTINGLIFYANIVQANHQILLPKITSQFNFIVVFISWLNLDFGIHVCFYKGLNINIYSWLQFLFPIYLWILVLIIIVSAHYSRRVSKRMGHNPVAVLATVLLISYGKMLKAIIVPLSPATLKTVKQSEPDILERVWLYNGDTKYNDPGHIALVIASILVLMFLFLPYTLLLTCGHWLQTKSHWRILSWINKLKPLMDAYYAPFKKGKCYWLGLFLLARCVLFLSVAFTPLFNDYVINLVIVTAVIAGLSLIKGQIYDKRYNDFLETSFLLNICFLSIASSYVQSKKSSDPDGIADVQNILSHVSVGIAFVYFIGIIMFHAYQRLRKIAVEVFHRGYSFKKQEEKASNEQSLEIITNSSVNLRELLLDDDS